MSSKRIVIISVLLVLLISVVASAGCIFGNHNPEDKIYVDYVKGGYYYFEDSNGNSFYDTLHAGDTTQFSNGFTPNEWINYVQEDIKFQSESKETFTTPEETVSLGYSDCEDSSILMARGLKDMGFDTCVLVMKSHVLAGISKKQVDEGYLGIKRLIYKAPYPWKDGVYYTDANGKKWYVIETTCKANIGMFDEDLIVEKVYYL